MSTPDVIPSEDSPVMAHAANMPAFPGPGEAPPIWRWQTSYAATSALLVAAALASCWLSLWLSHKKFSGYDVSPMIDSGWRVFNGQVPGRDFLVTFPASLYLTVAAAYRLFGVTWHAIALMACLQYLVLLIAGLRLVMLLRPRLGEASACRLATTFAVGQTILLVSINFPWHASMAQSFGLNAVLSTLVLTGWRTLPRGRQLEAFAHLVVALTVLFISKPNTSLVIVAVCLLVLLRAGVGWSRTVLVAICSAVFASLLLGLAHVTLPGALLSYRGLTGRIVPHGFLHGLFFHPAFSYGLGTLVAYALFVPALALLALALLRDRSWPKQPAALLAVGAIAAALVGMGTNFDFKLTDTPLLLLGIGILVLPGSRFRAASLLQQRFIAECGLLALALYFGISRYRMMWSSPDCQAVPIEDRFLGSMEVCPAVKETIHGIDAALQQEPHRDSVFMGPGLEFMYAARQIASPQHLPAWWDLGTSYPVEMQPQLVQAWKGHRFEMVFLDPQMLGYLPGGVQQDLFSGYDVVFSGPTLQVYRRRDTANGKAMHKE